MAVEPVMRDERLSSINPYFPREEGGCVYPYFYDMVLDGKPCWIRWTECSGGGKASKAL